MPPLRMLHRLMLMALLCGADATCPVQNPLVLDPPEVVEEYGSEVFVNCTSSYEDHDGMYWSNEEHEMTVDDTFIHWTGQLSAWNVTAKCIIKMNEFECSKDLKITLYKNPDKVTLFSLNNPVVETEFVLQCDVHDAAPVQNLTVKWYKDNEMIKTDSFLNTSKTPVSESSLLTVNVSRGDNGAEFRCEAQLDFGPKWRKLPPVSETKVISVQYAPEFSDNTLDVDLMDGDDVTLSCDAEGNPPPQFHWTRDGVNMMENTKNLSVTHVNVSADYTCTASNHLGRTNKSISIHVIKDVMRAPAVAVTTGVPPKVCPLTLTPGEVVVRFGDRASVNCSTSALDASGMGWEASVGGTRFEEPPSVTWTVEKLQVWSIKPKCYITLSNKVQCSTVPNVTLYKTPDAVSVSAETQGPMVEGVQSLLRCDIISVAPVRNLRVTWSMGEENYGEEMFNDTSATPVNKTSLLRVTPTRDHNGTLFRCKAELQLGPKGPETIPTVSSQPYTAVVHYKPMMRDCPSTFTGVEHYFRLEMLSCKADGNPPPTVHWYHEGKLINPSELLSRAHSGKYTAALVNELSSTNTSVDITFEFAPEFREGNYTREVTLGDNVTFACTAEGNPVPEIQWNFSPVENARETTGGRQKSVSVTGATSTNAGVYTCVATNKVGSVSRSVTLTMTENPDKVTLFSLNNPVAETEFVLQCDVHDAAPVQNLTVKWYKDNEMIKTDSFLNMSKTPVSESSLLTVNVSRGDNGAEFRCEAQLDFGPKWPKPPPVSETKVISVQYAPEFSNNTLDVDLMEGDDVTLSCDAEGNPPPQFHWTRDGVNMMENTKNLNVTHVNVSADYTCTASNHLGRTNKSISIHVIKDVMRAPAVAVPPMVCPLTLTPGEVVVRFGDRASVNCSTSALDASGMGWEASVGGTRFEEPPSVTWTVEKLQVWSIKPKCYITLSNKDQCFTVPNVTLYKTPDAVSVSAETQGPMVEGVQSLLRCDIISVAPVRNLRVTWSMGKENYGEEMFNDTSATPVNKTSLLRVTPTRDHNGTLFRCKAELQLGPKGPETIPTVSSQPYTAVVHYAPEFREGNVTREVTLGDDVTFACTAEGNPVPEIQWNFPPVENARETTGGRQKNVSVTGATSTNAGVYICVATNKVGSVSRSVTLTMTGSRGLSRIIRWLLILGLLILILILILILVMTLCKRRKKHGQYSFIPGAKEGSDIPLTTTSGGVKA